MLELVEPTDDPDEDSEDGNLDEDEKADDLFEEIWLPDADDFIDDDDTEPDDQDELAPDA